MNDMQIQLTDNSEAVKEAVREAVERALTAAGMSLWRRKKRISLR